MRSQLPCSMDKEIKGEGSQSSVNVSATIVNIKYITEKKGREREKEKKRKGTRTEKGIIVSVRI